jgi:hydrogenase nickel incorporation protein HypA/HybF
LIQVADIAQARGAEAVECITIEVGPLSGTEPDLLLNAFLVMRSGLAAAATLVVKRCPVEISCLHCGVTCETAPNRLICLNCGGWRTRVIAGAELRLLRVAMRIPELVGRLGAHSNAEQLGYV